MPYNQFRLNTLLNTIKAHEESQSIVNVAFQRSANGELLLLFYNALSEGKYDDMVETF